MAIHPELHAQSHSPGFLSLQQTRAISAWTDQAAASLQDLTVSEPSRDESVIVKPAAQSDLRGASVALAIPLDDDIPQTNIKSTAHQKRSGQTEIQQSQPRRLLRRESIQRDSLKRREALLKGKDGSRRRQRWENGCLLNNPWAEPPTPNDWLVLPTCPRHDPMPYYLAPLWDTHYAHLDSDPPGRAKNETHNAGHRVPKDLRMKLKHARAARGMLQDLEEEIRDFIQRWSKNQLESQAEGKRYISSPQDTDPGDEIVFMGRNGRTSESRSPKDTPCPISGHSHECKEKKMVLESLVDDRAAGFARWLVYSIASYYGLRTWSVMVGEPARREAYVGIERLGRIQPGDELPRPLWAQI